MATAKYSRARAWVQAFWRQHLRAWQIKRARPRHPAVVCEPLSGNPLDIVAAVVEGLRAHGCEEEEVQEYITAALSKDYGHLLVTTARWVRTP